MELQILLEQMLFFKVTVHKIEEKKEAELNDAFVASLNAPGIETIDQLRDNIKASLEAQHEQAFMAAKENAALGKLIDDCEVEVEESDIEKSAATTTSTYQYGTC